MSLRYPCPHGWFLQNLPVVYALNAIFINTFTLPMGKLLLWNKFDLIEDEHTSSLFLSISCVTLFFGFYSLWTASWVEGDAWVCALLVTVWLAALIL